jgi:hypothetical protein
MRGPRLNDHLGLNIVSLFSSQSLHGLITHARLGCIWARLGKFNLGAWHVTGLLPPQSAIHVVLHPLPNQLNECMQQAAARVVEPPSKEADADK